jgi:hypothetical protein
MTAGHRRLATTCAYLSFGLCYGDSGHVYELFDERPDLLIRHALAPEPCPDTASVSTAWIMRRNDLLLALATLRSMRAENFG